MARFPLTKTIKRFGARFKDAGYSLYVVGGAVRDHLLGLPIEDYDFATDAKPEEVMRLFRRVIPTGIEHGTVSVHFEGEFFEVTTFRTDGKYLDSRHPSSVNFVTDLVEDLRRRDFTINAFAADCVNGAVIDHNGGIADLKGRIIRAIGDANTRFDEDGLRILRAARIAAKLDFTIEEKTFKAMQQKRGNLIPVSAERIREELFKLLDSNHPRKGLEYLYKSGVLALILPELVEGEGVEQGGMHHEDV
ncbi:MAG: polynucleotide adenylyltransferase, partial [Sphaerochaeta sp.]